MEGGLRAFEREFCELHMHMFDESVNSIVMVNRILSKPGGCLLLVGESGVGRRNAATLVTHMLNYELFSPKITREYGIKEFRRDLKQILQTAGVDGTNTVLLLEDYQIITPHFLELINSLLSSGEIPGLYTHEEIEPLLSPLADQMR
jgi:dynein heavy chain 2